MPSTYEDLDQYFWRDYRLFAANARRATSLALLETYRNARADRARRLFGLKIFEELMLATEDLYMVFAAFRDRGKRVPLRTLIALNLGEREDQEIANQLASYDAAGDRAIWKALDLPDPSDKGALRSAFPDPNTDLRVVAHYLELLASALHNARENRVVQDRANVRLLNKLKHGFVAVDDPGGWPGAPQETEPPSPLSATVLTKGAVAGTVGWWGVRVDETAVEAYVKTIAAYADAAAIIALLCHEIRAPGASSGASAE